jgi:hypothetical protein
MRFMQKGGGNPPRLTTIGALITLGISVRATTKLKIIPRMGIYFVIRFDMKPHKGIANVNPNGTAIKSTGLSPSKICM